MSKHLEATRALFRERVLPHFPQAEKRFARYFREAYELIRALPVMEDNQSLPPVTLHLLNLPLAFAALGIKPLGRLEADFFQMWTEGEGKTLVANAGLEFYRAAYGGTYASVCFYDPLQVATILSQTLHEKIDPSEARTALRRLDRNMIVYNSLPELFGYPEGIRMDAYGEVYAPLALEIQSEAQGLWTTSLFVPVGHTHYRACFFGCTGYSVDRFVPRLGPFAAAAALVEEIRESPVDIVSSASLRSRMRPDGPMLPPFLPGMEARRMRVAISRSGRIGEWRSEKRYD